MIAAALTGGYAYFHSDYYYEAEAARRREREEAGAKRVEEVRRRESERYARQQREIEEEYRKRALESARLDTYEKVKLKLVSLRLENGGLRGEPVRKGGEQIGELTTVSTDIALAYVDAEAEGPFDRADGAQTHF